MKGIKLGIWLFMLFALAACSGGGGSDSPTAPASTDLRAGESSTGYIDTDNDVDIYRIRANEVNRYMLVHCAEGTSGSGVDLLVTVFEEDANGNRTRIFGKHKPQGGSLSADLDLWIYIDRPKDLVIEVRDLMADDHNTEIPYVITCSYQDSANGNHDFSTAKDLAIGPDGALTDSIETAGQVDCFKFTPTADGVYTLNVNHNKPGGTSDVQLAVTLYDHNGNRIMRVTDPNDTILAYLEAANGPYNVAVEDSDSMQGDAAATYEISVVAATAAETRENDTSDNAVLLQPDAQDVYTASGVIDYSCSSVSPEMAGDKDWYRIVLGTEGGETTYHPIKLTIDDGDQVNGSAEVRISLFDADMNLVTYYEHKAGGDAYTNQVRVEEGSYYVLVEPAGASQLTQSTTYQVQLVEEQINDAIEATDENTANTDIELTAGTPVTGYVSYLSDVDWYGIDVNTSTANVLSVWLTSEQSIVDYQVSIWLGDTMIKKVVDMDGNEGNSHVKTSILIPADTSTPGTLEYHIKVCDAQNNEGSAIPYTVKADISSIGPAPAGIGATGGQAPLYYSETANEAGETNKLELELNSKHQPEYNYNIDLLDFRTAHPEYQAAPGADGTVEITLPWISGYVDYQGDRDFFQLDLGKLDPNGAETSWYYDVEVHLVVPTASSVEYVWKLYLDNNVPNTIMDRPDAGSGIRACDGDITPETISVIDSVTPEGDEEFWIGSEMAAGAKFFVGLSDFNFKMLPGTPPDPNSDQKNANPDADWSYEEDPSVPYYFQVKLTYHPNVAHPN